MSVSSTLLIRTAIGNMQDITQLACNQSIKRILILFLLENEYEKEKNEACSRLYEEISRINDFKSKKELLQLKRDIFNDRKKSYISFLKSNSGLSPSLCSALECLFQKRIKLKKALDFYHNTFTQEYIFKDVRFESLAQGTEFLKGLAIANPNLFQNRDKKSEKIKIGLIKYLTRAYIKTSPFSTFTTICSQRGGTSVNNANLTQISVNVRLLKDIENAMFNFITCKPLYLIRLNPSVYIKNSKYYFLSVKQEREAINTLNITPRLHFIYEFVKKKQFLSYSELYIFLVQFLNKRESNRVIDTLINLGFIEKYLGIPYHEFSWDSLLVDRLKKYPEGILNHHLLHNFEEIRNIKDSFAKAEGNSRISLLNQANIHLKKIYSLLKQPIPSYPIFYEDSYKKQPEVRFAEQNKLVNTLSLFIRNILPNDTFNIQRRKLFEYYAGRYGSKKLEFISLYYDYISGKILNNGDLLDSTVTKNLSILDSTRVINERKTSVVHMNLLKRQNLEYHNYSSYSVFFQKYTENKNTFYVINNISPGGGRSISRFLNILPDKLTLDIRKKLINNFRGEYVVENTDGMANNIHFHPTITPHSVAIPNVFTSDQATMEMKDLYVRMNKNRQSLELVNGKNNKKVNPFNLSLTSVFARQHLFQFLNLFSPQRYIKLNEVLEPINRLYVFDKEEMKIFPRIVLNNIAVIQRKTWIFNPSHIYKETGSLSYPDLFLYSYRWKMKHNIPDEVFLYIDRKNEKDMIQEWPSARHKPQYINFCIPLLVKIFHKTLRNAKGDVMLVEMLPSSKSVRRTTKKVQEYVIDLNV